MSPHRFRLKLNELGQKLRWSETSLQSDRIKPGRNWVKYVLIEIYLYCKLTRQHQNGLLSVVQPPQFYIKTVDTVQTCAADVAEFIEAETGFESSVKANLLCQAERGVKLRKKWLKGQTDLFKHSDRTGLKVRNNWVKAGAEHISPSDVICIPLHVQKPGVC